MKLSLHFCEVNARLFVSQWSRFVSLRRQRLLRRFDCYFTASLHQARRSIGNVSLYVARWFVAIGAFRSSLLFRIDVVPSTYPICYHSVVIF